MKRVEDLRVVDLRNQLEKRGLDKSGIKAILVQRLKKVILEEEKEKNTQESENEIEDNKQNGEHTSDSNVSSTEDLECFKSEGIVESVVNEKDSPISSPSKSKKIEEDDIFTEVSAPKDEDFFISAVCEGGKANISSKCVSTVNEMDAEEEPVNEDVDEVLHILNDEAEDLDLEFQEQETSQEQDKSQDLLEERIVSHQEDGEKGGILETEDELNNLKGNEEDVYTDGKSSLEISHRLEDDTSINLLLEDEDKMLDYEETDRIDMDDISSTNEVNENEKLLDENTASTDKDNQDDKEKESSKEKELFEKDDNTTDSSEASNANRNLWVSGLDSNTKAQELKALFSKHGKVQSVKIVANSKTAGSKYFGFITMGSPDEVTKCIERLHRTELHGRLIQIEKAKGEPGGIKGPTAKLDENSPSKNQSSSRDDSRSSRDNERSKSLNSRERDRRRTPSAVDGRKGSRTPPRFRGRLETRGGHGGGRDRDRGGRGPNSVRNRVGSRRFDDKPRGSSPRNRGVLSFNRIVEERERERSKMKERMIRDEERFRLREEDKLRNLERRQREEALKLKRERELLRLEREKVEREKEKLLRIEKEQQRIERERLNRERDELRKKQMKFSEGRKGIKRSPPSPPRSRDFADRHHKRPANNNTREFNNNKDRPSRRSPPLLPSSRNFGPREGGRGPTTVGGSYNDRRAPTGRDQYRSKALPRRGKSPSPPPPPRSNYRHEKSPPPRSSSHYRHEKSPPPRSSSHYRHEKSPPPRSSSSHYDTSASIGMWRSVSNSLGTNNSMPNQTGSWASQGGQWVSGNMGMPAVTNYDMSTNSTVPFPAPAYGNSGLVHQNSRYNSMNHYKD